MLINIIVRILHLRYRLCRSLPWSEQGRELGQRYREPPQPRQQPQQMLNVYFVLQVKKIEVKQTFSIC